MPLAVGCTDYQYLIDEVKRYKDEIIVYYSGKFYGSCFADINPYQTISVRETDVKVKFLVSF